VFASFLRERVKWGSDGYYSSSDDRTVHGALNTERKEGPSENGYGLVGNRLR
jgi:hypothetical protein